MKKTFYDFNTLSDCQKHFETYNEVVCSGYTVTPMFYYFMTKGIKIQVEKLSDTQYEFKRV